METSRCLSIGHKTKLDHLSAFVTRGSKSCNSSSAPNSAFFDCALSMDVQQVSATEAVVETEAAASAGEAESVEGKVEEAAAAAVGISGTGFCWTNE